MRLFALTFAFVLAFASPLTFGAEGRAYGGYSTRTHSKTGPGVPRDSHGKIARSPQAKHEFQKSHPCPSTGRSSGACPGFVIDHVTPLKRGGADAPSNMQWQTEAAAKQKDRWE